MILYYIYDTTRDRYYLNNNSIEISIQQSKDNLELNISISKLE